MVIVIEPAEVIVQRRGLAPTARGGVGGKGRGWDRKSSRRGSLKVVRVVEPETMVVKGQLQQ